MVDPVRGWNAEQHLALIDSAGADPRTGHDVQAHLVGAQEQLFILRQLLQDLDQSHERILYVHVLGRAPRGRLASIRAYTELLAGRGGARSRGEPMLEILERNSVRLSVLIEDILTLSHLKSAHACDVNLGPGGPEAPGRRGVRVAAAHGRGASRSP